MSDVQYKCWRCNGPPVKVYGVPCTACRAILKAEYDAKVAANGGRCLYLPDDRPLPTLTEEEDLDMPDLVSVNCAGCGERFEFERGAGRRRSYCDRCKAERGTKPSGAPASRTVARPIEPKRVAEPETATAVLKIEPPPPPALPAQTMDLRVVATQLGEEIDELERALGVRLRLLRAIDQYFAKSA